MYKLHQRRQSRPFRWVQLPRQMIGVKYLWLCTVTAMSLRNNAETGCSCAAVEAHSFHLVLRHRFKGHGGALMRACHRGPAIQGRTNNASFVLQLGRINEGLLNVDISQSPSHPRYHAKAARACTTRAKRLRFVVQWLQVSCPKISVFSRE